MSMLKKTLLTVFLTFLAGISFSLQAEPLSYGEKDACSGCGMIVSAWPGPKAQVIEADEKKETFCSVRCMLCHTLDRVDLEQLALAVHDTARVDWEHPGEGVAIDAKKAWFVVGSRRRATMGASIAPFATEDEARLFQETWGGTLMSYGELSVERLKCPKKKSLTQK